MQRTDAQPPGSAPTPTPMIRVFADVTEVPVMDIVELQGRILITDDALTAARAAKAQRRATRHTRGRRSGAANTSPGGVDGAAESPQLACTADRRDCVDAASAQGLTRAESADSGARGLESGGGGVLLSSVSSSEADEDSEVSGAEASGDASASLTSSSAAVNAAAAAADVVEVPLGHVEQDRLSEKRCTLCVDTLRVHGSRSSFKHPWLVLRECTATRLASLRRHLDVQAPTTTAASTAPLPAQDDDDGDDHDNAQPSSSDDDASSTVLFSDWLQQHPEALTLDALFLDDILAAEEQRQARAAAAMAPSRDDSLPRKRPRSADDAATAPATSTGDDVGLPVEPQASAPVAHTAAAQAAAEGGSRYKNYELVGIVRGSVLFNSKPARVFQ